MCSSSSSGRMASSKGTNGGLRHDFHFWGPLFGPVAIMLGVPAVNYLLVYACSSVGCVSFPHLPNFSQSLAHHRPATVDGFLVVAGWVLGQLLLHLLLPGRRELGAPLPDGSRLTYKLTGEPPAAYFALRPPKLGSRMQCSLSC